MKNRNHIFRTAAIMCAAIALLFGVRVLGQAPPPAPPKNQAPPSAPPLRVTTRVVQISVIAQDGDGHPVTGLTQDDFKILDNGVPQKIVSFSQHSGRLTANIKPGVRPMSANTFSNRVDEKTGVPPSVTVILLDALNTNFHDMASARAQVVKFLRQIHPEDRVALYELTTKIIVLHDFTSDTATLLRALAESPNPQNGAPAPTLQVTAADEAALDVHALGAIAAPDPGWLAAELAREAVFDQSNQVEATTDAFTQIARHLSRLPGRKNLIWVSGSFPFNIDWDSASRSESPSFAGQINSSVQAMSDANVAIYPVDARGLMAQRMGEGGTLFRTTIPSSPPQATLDTMQKLAQGTGGVAYYNTNGIAEAIRHAIDDSSLTYELTYYPTNEIWNGRFRDIKVDVNRSGVHLRYRKGYFATPATHSTPASVTKLMTAAARDPLEATQLGLNVQINAVDAPGPRQAKVEVRIDPDQLHFDLNAGRWDDNVEIAWVELDNQGKDVGHSAKTLTLTYPDEQHTQVLREGLVFKSTIQMVDTCVELRLVARDGGTGAIGSVNIPLSRIFTKTGKAATPNP
jgi:VWFA-related protein